MKKAIAGLLSAVMILCLGAQAACAEAADTPDASSATEPAAAVGEQSEPRATAVTVEDLLAANTAESVFANHDTMLFQREDPFSDEKTTIFFTRDFACDLSTGGLFDSEDNWQYVDVNGEAVFALDWYVMSDMERENLIWKPEDLFPVMYEEMVRKTELTDVTENEDGTLTLTCILHADDFAAAQEAYGNALPEEYAGMEDLLIYTVNAETLEILRQEEYTVLGEETSLISRVAFEYDAEQPEEAGEMLALAVEFRTSGVENSRTVTVIYDVGTDREESFSVVTDRRFRVVPILREGYQLFSDPEGTTLFHGRDEVSDLVLYAFAA
ncbi:MAG: hypothetical protein K6C12_08575 [Oscillospiraceae bacterium]|nr:hypothetical protein [Oscillospiraceae bacterium]